MIFAPSRRLTREVVFAIQTPSAGIVKVGPKNAKDARTTVRAYTRARWPLTWRELHAQGYRVVMLSSGSLRTRD